MTPDTEGPTKVECTCDDHEYGYSHCDLHVGCDEDCRALRDPPTDDAAELLRTMVHYREHSYLYGCSHGS